MNFIMQRAIFFIALLLVWYLCYPNILQNMEETAFWTDAPDLYNIMYQWPKDWAEIASMYLAQYFIIHFIGAAIMALLPTIILLAFDVIIWQLFRNRRMQCLAFLPALLVVLLFLNDGMLTRYIQVVSAAIVLAMVVFVLTFKCKKLQLKYYSRWFLITGNVAPYVIILLMVVLVKTNPHQQSREYTAHIEHLAGERNWDELFDITYPERLTLDDNQKAYSLLALSQKGLLGEKLFNYPIKGLDNIFAHAKNFRFNSFFCHELGLPNEAIRYAFEEGQYMPAGASFGTVRRMVDWLIEKGDDPELVDFYLNILSHSSCNSLFVNSRTIKKINTPLKTKDFKPEFVGSPSFLYEASLKIEQDPTNTIARDYLLCGMLILGNTEAFYKLMNDLYVQMDNTPLPVHYLEALTMLCKTHPEIVSTYNISAKMQKAYLEFEQLSMSSPSEAQKKFEGTYWIYFSKLLDRKMEGIKENVNSLHNYEFGT